MNDGEFFNSIRKEFPVLQGSMNEHPLVYLDSAASAQKPLSVIDAMDDFYRNKYGTVHRAVYELSVFATDAYQNARKKAQKFLNAAKPEEIIFTRGTTESINLIATCLGKMILHPGDEVLISEMEHHSNIVPWQMICEEKGAILKVVPFNDRGELDLEQYKKMLSSRTKIVAVTHVSNSLGTLNPIETLINLAHKVGAYVIIDGAQAAPHIKVDVRALNADFYVFSGHKVYGPTGIGVLYGKEALLNQMPPYQGGGDMIEKVTFEKTTYNVLPLKFEAGTPMISEVIGLGAAFDFIEKVGFKRLESHEQELLAYGTEALQKIPGLTLIGTAPHKVGILSFVMEGIHPLDIGTMLDLKGIAIRTGHHCAQPVMRHFHVPATARASLGVYNNKEDIDRLVEALKEIKTLFTK